jgi:dolichol-phosphate mannosyltransferase
MGNTYVVIPTYNEADNIQPLLQEILALNVPDLTALVVDDNSPDGTGQLADRLARNNDRIKVLHRTEARGRGLAGIAGFKFALQAGADYIIEMDADFSHQPRYIPDFLKAIKNYDVVIGSRFIAGGVDIKRTFLRRLVTLLARKYIQLILGIKIKDVTSGYRCFRHQVLVKLELDRLISRGPSLVSEILYLATLKNFRLHEIPIVFIDRQKGATKLNLPILLNTLYMIYKFRRLYKI